MAMAHCISSKRNYTEVGDSLFHMGLYRDPRNMTLHPENILHDLAYNIRTSGQTTTKYKLINYMYISSTRQTLFPTCHRHLTSFSPCIAVMPLPGSNTPRLSSRCSYNVLCPEDIGLGILQEKDVLKVVEVVGHIWYTCP